MSQLMSSGSSVHQLAVAALTTTPMLEGVPDLTLDQLNDISQPWIELEYNRKVHSEIDATPLQRFLGGKSVAQSCRSTEELQLAFTKEVRRTQRRSDGTLHVRLSVYGAAKGEPLRQHVVLHLSDLWNGSAPCAAACAGCSRLHSIRRSPNRASI